MSVSVCLFVCRLPYFRNHTAELHQFLCMFSMVLARRRWDELCTSGFVDDVMFSHNGPYGALCASLSGKRG